MIRVLNVIGRRPTGGIGAVVTNYQSSFQEKIVFDYLIFSDDLTGEFDSLVKKMGSRVYVLPALKSSRFISINHVIKRFFSEIKDEYDIVHIHTVNIAFLVARYAKKMESLILLHIVMPQSFLIKKYELLEIKYYV